MKLNTFTLYACYMYERALRILFLVVFFFVSLVGLVGLFVAILFVCLFLSVLFSLTWWLAAAAVCCYIAMNALATLHSSVLMCMWALIAYHFVFTLEKLYGLALLSDRTLQLLFSLAHEARVWYFLSSLFFLPLVLLLFGFIFSLQTFCSLT